MKENSYLQFLSFKHPTTSNLYNVNMYKNYSLRNSVSTVKKSQCISFDSTLVP